MDNADKNNSDVMNNAADNIRCSSRIAEIEDQLAGLPRGSLVYKIIKGKSQPYLQWNENGRTRSRYIKLAERERILAELDVKRKLREELKTLKEEKTYAAYNETIQSVPMRYAMRESGAGYALHFRMNVICGNELLKMTTSVKGMKRRDCFSGLEKYVHGNYPGRICLLYGLRRTGKTTLLFQLADSLTMKELSKTAYIKARVTDTMADINHDLRLLSEEGYSCVLVDEVTLMEDFIDSAALFSDVYSMMGMKLILSGTDSLGFWFTETQELYDRAFMIHTTYIPFHEYSRLLNINSIDEYIRYGGTLRRGETDFDDEDIMAPDAAFRDDESTRRYIDTAICRNIQHSLACCRNGEYFRHLRDLYEAGELTGAINRIIESMNHRFLISTLVKTFKSHDLGSAAEMLRKQPEASKRTYILDRIDRDAVTERLMQMLDIRNKEDQSVGITQTHVNEIKEYLRALDLIKDLPSETTVSDGEPEEYVIFTQPGMRYSQAQALVHILIKDRIFSSFSLRERELACECILEDVRGRMMEDIVLFETARSLSYDKHAFKLYFARNEFDMLIYDSQSGTCEAYEIKHSAERTPNQYRTLISEEVRAATERIYGKIMRRCVIYRGTDIPPEENNGVEYINVERYLSLLSFAGHRY